MDRRTYLMTATGVASFLGGCLGSVGGSGDRGPTNDDDLPRDPVQLDGYPPEFDQQPAERDVDTDSYETLAYQGTAVPLAPIEDVYYWYASRKARFADARDWTPYFDGHIYGAVRSTAPGGGPNDPVEDWPKDDRVVCYCGCPHGLAVMRAATLIDDGWREVYALDEGFWEWHDRNYPMFGHDIESSPTLHVVEGVTDPAYSGEFVLLRHVGSGQREVAPIGDDGRYELHVRFSDVAPETVVTVETPAYSVHAPLGELERRTLGV